MNFLRILFPTWKLFNKLGTVPELLYRVNNKAEWIPAFERPTRSLINLFLNPEGNLYLARQSLVERLLYDSQRTKNLENEISFQLVKNRVHQLAREKGASQYEFLVRVRSFDMDTPKIEDVITTAEYKV